MTYEEQLELRARIQEWCTANPDAAWIDAPAEFHLNEYPEGQIAPYLGGTDRDGNDVTWCRRHDVEFSSLEVCSGCVRPPARPNDIAEQPHWERLQYHIVLSSVGMVATLRCTEHGALFDDTTACLDCLRDDEAA